MIDALKIRVAEATDAEALSRVHTSSVRGLCHTHYGPEQIESWAAVLTPEYYGRVLTSQELFLAERGGEAVAFGRLDLESGVIVGVYVAPEAAGQGVGAFVLNHLEEVSRMHGWSKLHLTASLNAVPFCQKMGYEPVGPFNYELASGVKLECVDMRKVFPK